MRFTQAHIMKLSDPAAEAARKVHETQIRELQDQARELGTAGGRLLGVQILTGSGTYTPTPGTMTVDVEGVACGGGGGGGQGVNGCGGGGTSGAYFRKRIDSNGRGIRGGAYSAPTTGGAGGAATGGVGSTGSNATIVINGITYTLKGGPGGGGMPAPAGTTFAGPGSIASGSSTGDLGAPFQGGGTEGIFLSGSFGTSGDGGSCPLGAGGRLRSTADPGTGNPGQGYGGGGGGGQNGAGGSGAPAVWIVKEYN